MVYTEEMPRFNAKVVCDTSHMKKIPSEHIHRT